MLISDNFSSIIAAICGPIGLLKLPSNKMTNCMCQRFPVAKRIEDPGMHHTPNSRPGYFLLRLTRV